MLGKYFICHELILVQLNPFNVCLAAVYVSKMMVQIYNCLSELLA